ncbi:MAG: creatininase family protein [Symbiobacteriaceae bacterium]|nr:creatininase family protein [Symbiobacteriaceae bacterium]
MKRYVLGEMSWPEVAAELEGFKIGIVPVGSCEQHGPNATFVTDSDTAYEFTKKLSERLGNKALVFPPITYGISPHHMGFPGSATLRIETMLNVLCDVALSITKHGISKILFVNGHGGNSAVLGTAVVRLKYEYDIDAYWSNIPTGSAAAMIKEKYGLPLEPGNTGHACEMEISDCLYLCPWVVKEELAKGETVLDGPHIRRIFSSGGMATNWRKHASHNGALGDARKASYEAGKEMVEAALDTMVTLVDEILKL